MKSINQLTFNLDDGGGLITASIVGCYANVDSAVFRTSVENSENVSGLSGVLLECGSVLKIEVVKKILRDFSESTYHRPCDCWIRCAR